MTTTYYSFDYFEVKVIDSNKKIVKGAKLKLKIYTGKKYKTVTVTSDFEGIARYVLKGGFRLWKIIQEKYSPYAVSVFLNVLMK